MSTYVPWAQRSGPPPGPAPPAQYSDRTRLAYQFRRGNKYMDDDTDESESFAISSFALGSARKEGNARKFLRGFGSEADAEHSRLSFNFDRRWLYVFCIPLSYSTTPPAFVPLEMEIPFEDIVNGGMHVIRQPPGEDDRSRLCLTITTRRPARFYSKIKGKQIMRRATERDFVFSVGPQESTPGRSVEEMKAKGYIIHEGHAGPIEAVSDDAMTVKVNTWLTWQFEFVLDSHDRYRFRNKILALRLAAREEGQDVLAHVGERRIKVVAPEQVKHVDPNKALRRLDFQLRYLVEGIVSHGIIVPSEIPILVRALDDYCRRSDDLKARVLTSLFNEERIHNITIKVAVQARKLRKRRAKLEPHHIWVYRCLCTPTRLVLMPPEQETSNDALRKHSRKADRFLRVQFADEEDRIQINPTVLEADFVGPAEGTIARVRRALNSGLQITGRHYVFLAYGASSAREHSCWFLAEDEDITADGVRAGLGFAQIKDKIVAKHAARMGIPFSATRAVNIQVNVRKDLPDVFSPDKVCFTDGVGRCGYKVARQAAREFGIINGIDAYPSAIQIRCGGIKGVLGVWPDNCGELDVAFRPSQIKFVTNREQMKFGLNVVRISQFHRAFLNRQFIILMSHLGVPDNVLINLFHEAVVSTRGLPERLQQGFQSDKDVQAAVGLSQFPIKELADAGFNHDPMFYDVCKVLELRLLANLKWKARLEVKKSVYLMGIADELNVLKEGEVFCQYENPAEPDKGPVVVKGPCVIMRAPSLHPGDVRIVKAVDHPQLRHLKNVIVFSVRGTPLPNMLSGGDLDGDDYTLIWDKRLLPKYQEEPADYTPPKPKLVQRVTMDNVKEFFVDYIKNDILGQVSNAHLAHADRVGPQSRVCRDLAQQASFAVDFPKTGVPAEMTNDMRPRMWPTFMGKDLLSLAKNNYDSKKILGKLFRLVHEDGEFRPVDIRSLRPEQRVDARLSRFDLPSTVLDDAYRLKEDYDDNVLGLMKRYRITEAEVVSGIILRNLKRRRGRDADIKEPVETNYKDLAGRVLEEADRFLRRRQFKGSLTPRQIYGIAAYQVTYVDAVRRAAEVRLGIDPLTEELEAMSVADTESVDCRTSRSATASTSCSTIGNTNGRANGSPDGSTNGHENSATNGSTDGHANGSTNSSTNGRANGHANGHANGRAKGHAKGHANGPTSPASEAPSHAPSHANGHANGEANGGANGRNNGHDNGRRSRRNGHQNGDTVSVPDSTHDGVTDGSTTAYFSGPTPAPLVSFPWVFWEALCYLPVPEF